MRRPVQQPIDGAPSRAMAPRSLGTKIVLLPSAAADGPEYAIGMEASAMWFNTSPNAGAQYKFYFNSISRYVFDNNNLTLPAAPTANMHAATKQYVDQSISSGVGPWVALTFPANGSGQNLRARWINNPTNGSVQLRGQIYWAANIASGNLASVATLPAGLRPSVQDMRFPVHMTHTGGGTLPTANLILQTSGNVQISPGAAATANVITWLEGIVFPLGGL
jgi:hypothetical protein